jgi:hypothetical protein
MLEGSSVFRQAKMPLRASTKRPVSADSPAVCFFLRSSMNARIKKQSSMTALLKLARPERFELPTTKFVAWYSIQLSYGRMKLLAIAVRAAGSSAAERNELPIIPG